MFHDLNSSLHIFVQVIRLCQGWEGIWNSRAGCLVTGKTSLGINGLPVFQLIFPGQLRNVNRIDFRNITNILGTGVSRIIGKRDLSSKNFLILLALNLQDS